MRKSKISGIAMHNPSVNIKNETAGITLIALVITIIVLLILAGVSIATLTGNNGILTQVNKAKTDTTEGKVKELVSLAIGSLQTKNLGDTSKITPEAIAQEVNNNERRTDVSAENNTFPTYIIFEEEGIKVPVDIDFNIGDVEENKEEIENVYSVEDAEEKIAPTDLFDYEVIDKAQVSAITTESLPTKKIKITGIKPKYCNAGGYNPETDEYEFSNTNYGIDYHYEPKITDTLVIPYQVEYEGEMYRVTEVDLSIQADWGGSSIPNINTIIYPNTVTKIECRENDNYDNREKKTNVTNVNNIILSSKLKEIPYRFFQNCINLKSIIIPNSVTTIKRSVFFQCTGLTDIYCEATPQPSGWDAAWKDGCSATVHWGKTGPQ